MGLFFFSKQNFDCVCKGITYKTCVNTKYLYSTFLMYCYNECKLNVVVLCSVIVCCHHLPE